MALLGEVDAVTQLDCWWVENGDAAEGEAGERFMAKFPQITCLKELDEAYPGAKFVLNWRETGKWIHSVDRYWRLREVLVSADIPGLPSGKGGDDAELGRWYEDHNRRVRQYFADRDPGTFLELQLEEGNDVLQKRLEAFLEAEVQWGHYNAAYR